MVDWEELAAMLVAITLIVTAGGVALLRPLAKQLGSYLEQAALEKKRRAAGTGPEQSERVTQLLENLDARLGHLEERVNFTESVLLPARREQGTLPHDRDS